MRKGQGLLTVCFSSLSGQLPASSWFLQVIYLNTHYAVVGLLVELWADLVEIRQTSEALSTGTSLAGACPFLAEWTPWGGDHT